MMLARRGFLGALLAAPAIIRTPGLLMAVKPPPPIWVYRGLSFGFTSADVSNHYARLLEASSRKTSEVIAENIYRATLTGYSACQIDSDGNMRILA